jgi:hypothetical protein
MFGSLTCRNGHTWAPPPGPAAPGEEDLCPYCGELPCSPSQNAPHVWIALGVLIAFGLCGFVEGAVAVYLGEVDRWGQGLFYGVMFGAVAVLAAASHLRQERRARRMESASRGMGFRFAGQVSPRRLGAFGPFYAFTLGRTRTAFHLMTGRRDGLDVALFEMQCTAWDGSAFGPRRTVVIVSDRPPEWAGAVLGWGVSRHFVSGAPGGGAIQAPGAVHAPAGVQLRRPGEQQPASLPAAADLSLAGLEFRLEPVGSLDLLGLWFGWQDVGFGDDLPFSNRYWVCGPSGEAIRRAFRPEVLHFFAQRPGWWIEVLGGRLLAHCKGPCDPADCPRLIDEAVQMHQVLMRAWAESQNG